MLFGFGLRFVHQCDELCKEVIAVVRAGGCFGVVLNAKDGQVFVLKPFDSIVVKIDVSQLNLRLIHGLPIDSKAVVL